MDTLERLNDISLRLDQLESTGEWLARALVHTDSSGSQAGSMIMALAEDIRDRLMVLVNELEKAQDQDSLDESLH